MSSTAPPREVREATDARDRADARDPFESFRPKLLIGLSVGAVLALLAGGAATAAERPLDPVEVVGFVTALALFCAAPVVLLWTGSVLSGTALLLVGGVISIFVPAYFGGGLQAPQVIWLLVIPILCPLYFGSRVTAVAGGLSLSAFAGLYVLEIFEGLPFPSPNTADFTAFVNLAAGLLFVMAVSIGTHAEMRKRHRDLLVLRDDLERRSEELAESESRKSAIIDSALTGLVTADAGERILDCNPAACHMLGYARDDVIGRRISEVMVPQALQEAHRVGYSAALSAASRGVYTAPRQLIALRADGEQIPVEVRLQRFSVDGPAEFMAQLRDLRAERRAEALVRQREDQLQRAQRLEGVGRLAGGVAHDFNNLLTVIGGYSESIEEDPDSPASIRDQAREISRATERATSITRQMLAFSRGQNLSLADVDLHALLSDLEATLRVLVPPEIRLELGLTPVPWAVRANPTELERAMVNLVTNAVHAMPDGGRLSVQTEYHDFDSEPAACPPSLEPGSYAVVRVIDDGHGMTPEIRDRAFEPFFTTKETGKGTGLGLASVYGAVTQFGGHVDLASEPGVGTRVEVYLPKSSGEPDAVARGTAVSFQRTQSVLLVEDEAGIRTLVSDRLRREGYRVLEAADADEALELAAAGGDAIGLLISDIVMPNRSGASLAAELRDANPDLPVIFMSGFIGEPFFDLARDFPGAELLTKPLRMESLLESVGRVLLSTETEMRDA